MEEKKTLFEILNENVDKFEEARREEKRGVRQKRNSVKGLKSISSSGC